MCVLTGVPTFFDALLGPFLPRQRSDQRPSTVVPLGRLSTVVQRYYYVSDEVNVRRIYRVFGKDTEYDWSLYVPFFMICYITSDRVWLYVLSVNFNSYYSPKKVHHSIYTRLRRSFFLLHNKNVFVLSVLSKFYKTVRV